MKFNTVVNYIIGFLFLWRVVMVINSIISEKDGEADIFEMLWKNYETCGPTPRYVRNLLMNGGNEVKNDHVAFRTFNVAKVNIDQLSNFFIEEGYVEGGSYVFEKKKLLAKHFEKRGFPKVFISELRVELLSEKAQKIINEVLKKLDDDVADGVNFLVSGRNWDVNYETYKTLLEESEYAAWLYVWGFRVNHFTVSVNFLHNFDTLTQLNEYLKTNGLKLNSKGGEIKGSPDIFLEQSSTMADIMEVEFLEEDGSFKNYEVRSCYYEFATRYADESGYPFNGFHAKSADKIFESTDTTEGKKDEL